LTDFQAPLIFLSTSTTIYLAWQISASEANQNAGHPIEIILTSEAIKFQMTQCHSYLFAIEIKISVDENVQTTANQNKGHLI